jgi:hypothetical protein
MKEFESLFHTVLISYDGEDTKMDNIPVVNHAKQRWMPFEDWLSHHLGLPVNRVFFDENDNPAFSLEEWDEDMHKKLIQYFPKYRLNAYSKINEDGDFYGVELICTLEQVW